MLNHRFFTIKTKDEKNVGDISRKGRNIIIHQLTCLKDDIRLNDNIFVVFGGDKPAWKTGLVAIGHVSRLPFEIDWKNQKSYSNYKIAIDIDVYFDALVRSDFLPYPETYGTIGISPICTWEPNQAITSVDPTKAKAILQAIMELRPKTVIDLKPLLGDKQYSSVTSSIKRYFIGESPIHSKQISLPSSNSGYTFSLRTPHKHVLSTSVSDSSRPFLSAIRTKPFLLLAGISGTGKSRIVRDLARACWPLGDENRTKQRPDNYALIPVRPNWHDSTELLGYVSRIDGEKFVAGPFLKFIAKAWKDLDRPHFLCLDEMNLAPVEQYFAEYLSVVETRKGTGKDITTDPILENPFWEERSDEELKQLLGDNEKAKKQLEELLAAPSWYSELIWKLFYDRPDLNARFLKEGLSLPPNLIVMGTVNMDETTFSFSRKVLDRAMTIEMNEVNLRAGLGEPAEAMPDLSQWNILPQWLTAEEVYEEHKDVVDKVLGWLEMVNAKLEGSPFKIAYRTRNEVVLYVVNNIALGGKVHRAFDEAVNMKILPRIEGDNGKVGTVLDELMAVMEEFTDEETNPRESSPSLLKLGEMKRRMEKQYYCTYWS